MNVTNVQAGFYSPYWSPPVPEPKKEQDQAQDNVTISFDGLEKSQSGTIKKPGPEELVMKPTPISAEERMSQVISPEQMKDLLSMIVRSRFSSQNEGKIGVHRFDLKG